jgi:hypothetical protein
MTRRVEKKEKTLDTYITILHQFDDQARKKRRPDTHTQLNIAEFFREKRLKCTGETVCTIA